MQERACKVIGWQIGSLLVVCASVFFALAKVVVSNEANFRKWVDEQSRGMQVVRQGINTLVVAAADPDKRVKGAVVITSAPGSLAAAAELTQGYLAASPFLFKTDMAPKPEDIVVISAIIDHSGVANTISKAGSKECSMTLSLAKTKDTGGAGWVIRDAHCSPQ